MVPAMKEAEEESAGAPEGPPPTVLPCSGRGWKTLPLMSHFAHVTTLELDDNRLTDLPSRLVTDLPILEKLDVARNKLRCLPKNIGDWTRLKEISAPYNRITLLPVSISKLWGLEYFNLEGNPLNENLQAMLSVDRKWGVAACYKFARQIVMLSVQLPQALAETDRFITKCDLSGYPPLPAPAPAAKRTQSAVKKNRKATAPVPEPKLGTEVLEVPTEVIPRRRPSALQFPEEGIAANRGNDMDDMDTALFDYSPGISELSKLELRSSSSTGLVDTLAHLTKPTMRRTTGSKFWTTKLSLLVLDFFLVVVKYGLYASCLFGSAMTLTAMHLDKCMMLQILAQPEVNAYVPDWVQDAIVSSHSVFVEKLSAHCMHFPIFRTPPPSPLTVLLQAVAYIWGYVYAFFDTIL